MLSSESPALKQQNRCDQNKDKQQAVETNKSDSWGQLQSTLFVFVYQVVE